MAKRNSRNRRYPPRKQRMKFWEAVRKIGFKRALRYEIRHPRHYPWYPIWFAPMLVSMIILAIILFFYPIEYLPILFYILEIIVIGYMIYRLLKRLNRIRIKGSLLRLYGLKLLSGLVSAIGILLLFFTIISYPFALLDFALNQESLFASIITFGTQWHTPYIIPLFLEELGLGLLLIGAYLMFKFKMKSGNVIWVGKM